MQKTKFKESLEIATVIIFFSVFVLSLLQPVSDPDIFWHLKTGEWIWQNKSLPDTDPFSFTAEPSVKASFILKQYWVAQLILYGFYQTGGFYGIILFRCLIYLGIGLLLYYWIRRKGNSRLTTLLFLMPSVYFSTVWFGERPNYLSVLFATIVIYLLENMRERHITGDAYKTKEKFNPSLLLLPSIMLLWANIHGGFILGVAIIGLYLITESLSLLRYKEDAKHYRVFFSVCILSIFVCFLNPNTYNVIPVILEMSGSYKISSEMVSTISYAKSGDYRGVIIIGAVVLPLLLKIKQLRCNQFLNCFFLIFLTLFGERYIPFLVYISTPIISELWIKPLHKIFKKVERLYINVFIVLTFAVFLLLSNLKTTVFNNSVVASVYPKEAVKLIITEKPEGELFNDYNDGGFLIWSLWPNKRVFIDSRGLSRESIMATYERVLFYGSLKDIQGIPEWKKVLDEYNIKIILIPAIDTRNSGFFMCIVRRLTEDPEWHLILLDGVELLFIKETDKNKELIKTYSQSKIFAYVKAIEQAERYRSRQPNDWKIYVTLGEINLYIRRPKTALQYLEAAVMLNPSLKNTALSSLINKLRDGEDYSELMDKIFREPV